MAVSKIARSNLFVRICKKRRAAFISTPGALLRIRSAAKPDEMEAAPLRNWQWFPAIGPRVFRGLRFPQALVQSSSMEDALMTDDASKLFSPFRLGDLELKNRVAMAPLTRNRASQGSG